MDHYNQQPRRKAEFITPPNNLKAKVGSGGLSEAILNKAQELLENNTVDFLPLGEMYLNTLMKSIEQAKNAHPDDDQEYIISAMLYPAMQLKANGGMFHYPLVTTISDRLIQYLEVIEVADIESVEIVLAFHTTIRAVILGRITGDGGRHGAELIEALDDACLRYFERHPHKKLA
tara:strand:+ start:1084 stop:1608 length:525 start_codon:yes stop_codon:yes gene_type:complete